MKRYKAKVKLEFWVEDIYAPSHLEADEIISQASDQFLIAHSNDTELVEVVKGPIEY